MSNQLTRRILIGASALMLSGIVAATVPAGAQTSATFQQWDTDHDGTLDLTEVNAAASALFDKLDKDADGTLDKTEVGKRLSSGSFDKADLDKDGTLSKDEYLALVEQRFKAADADHDGTLSSAELKSAAGKALLHLLQ
jgi:Ca2+-binding EF-hand superfamily protein